MEFCDALKLKNTLFLDFVLCDFVWDIENAVINDHMKFKFSPLQECPEIGFKAEKISSSQFKIKIKRTDNNSKTERDNGYYLEFILSLLGHRELPKRLVMDCLTESVSVVYNISDMKKEPENATYGVLFCVIKMHEETLLENDARKEQEEMILNVKENNEEDQDKLKDMAYLMGRESLTDIFSGRQDFDFAIEKVSLIERTLIFADDIANKVRAKKNGTAYFPHIPRSVYLQYILDESFINECNVRSLYTEALYYGLPFLADECADYMFNLLEDHEDNEYIVDILISSITTDNLQLMYKALDVYNEDAEAIRLTNAWTNLTEEHLIFKQIIEDEAKLRRQRKYKEHQNSESSEEISDEDSSEASCGTNEEEILRPESPTEGFKSRDE